MGRASRTKGAAAEREVVQLLNDHLGEGYAERNTPHMFDCGADIRTAAFSIECKRCERPRFTEWFRQAVTQADDKIPVLAHRRNREEWMFYLPMTAYEFAEYVREVEIHGRQTHPRGRDSEPKDSQTTTEPGPRHPSDPARF